VKFFTSLTVIDLRAGGTQKGRLLMQQTSPIRLTDDFLGGVLLEEQLREVTGSGLTFSQLRLFNGIAHTEGHTITDGAAFSRCGCLPRLTRHRDSIRSKKMGESGRAE